MLSLDQQRADDAVKELHQQVKTPVNQPLSFSLALNVGIQTLLVSASHLLPQIEQLQTSLQAACDERSRLEDDLQRNKEMVSWCP